jgi:D-alanine--poly(phosphoribitol) ligase subunit 2
MIASDLHDRILTLFSTALNIEVPSVDTDLFDAGVLDSLAFVELLLQLEREFGVAAALDDLQPENFNSVARIAAFVAARVGASRGRVLSMDRRERLA